MNAAATPHDEGNGKVTLALLGQKLDALAVRVDSIDRTMATVAAGQETRLRSLENANSAEAVTIKNVCDELEKLDNKVEDVRKIAYTWNGINTGIGALIAAFMAALKGQP